MSQIDEPDRPSAPRALPARHPGRREVLRLASLSALLSPLLACTAGHGERGFPSRRLVIATGGTKGVYYRYGAVLADRIRNASPTVAVQNRSTTGSVENLRLLASAQAMFAFTAADAAADAYAGRTPFRAPVPLRAAALLYGDYLHLLVPAHSRVRDITDLRGLRVSLGPAGSGTTLIADRLLALAHVRRSEITNVPLGINESIAALADGRIAAFFWSGGLPTQGIVELAERLPIRLIPLKEAAEAMRSAYGARYRLGTIPAGIYQSETPVVTLAVPDLLVTLASADAQAVFEVTRVLFSGRDEFARVVPEAARLDPRTAIFTQPLPLHDGALRYYRSVKP
jgi:TRAP transporter TAXI family solute receptor